ncbi:hypothetical protein ACU4GD_02755 [Cupriavidus basilensis]
MTAPWLTVENPAKMPADPSKIEAILEPIVTRQSVHAAGLRGLP